MSKRYSRLFETDKNLYVETSPVIIVAGALLKDNTDGRIIGQLKIQNISEKAIKAAIVELAPLDVRNTPIGSMVKHQYLDISVKRDEFFGVKDPIVFPDISTRGFIPVVTEVIFEDNTAWNYSGSQWSPLKEQEYLSDALGDDELARQYRIKFSGSSYQYLHQKGLWMCHCGGINKDGESVCHECKTERSAIENLDLEQLKADCAERLKQEEEKELARQKAIEEDRIAREEAERVRKQKVKKLVKRLAIILPPIIAVAVVAAILLTSHFKKVEKYNTALEYINSSRYTDAVELFEELGGFKDSEDMVLQTKYDQANYLLKNKNYEQATSIFVELGDYKDSKEKLSEAQKLAEEIEYSEKYKEAEQYFADKDYDKAISYYEDLGDYKDSIKMIKKSKYKKALKLIDDEKFDEAKETFVELGDYADSSYFVEELSNLTPDSKLNKYLAYTGELQFTNEVGFTCKFQSEFKEENGVCYWIPSGFDLWGLTMDDEKCIFFKTGTEYVIAKNLTSDYNANADLSLRAKFIDGEIQIFPFYGPLWNGVNTSGTDSYVTGICEKIVE